MRNLLMISLAAATVLSCACAALFLVPSFRWKPRDYRCALLTEDIALRGQGTDVVLGTLKRGAVLFAPTRDDMAVSDPGDIQLHKVYIRLPPEALDRLVLLPPKRPDARVAETVCNILETVPLAATTNASSAPCGGTSSGRRCTAPSGTLFVPQPLRNIVDTVIRERSEAAFEDIATGCIDVLYSNGWRRVADVSCFESWQVSQWGGVFYNGSSSIVQVVVCGGFSSGWDKEIILKAWRSTPKAVLGGLHTQIRERLSRLQGSRDGTPSVVDPALERVVLNRIEEYEYAAMSK